MEEKKIWKEMIQFLEKRISKAHLLTYFQESALSSIHNNTATISSNNPFTMETLKNRYSDEILEAIQSLIPEVCEIVYEVKTLKKSDKVAVESILRIEEKKPLEIELIEGITSRVLNERYSLDNFVVGECNSLAAAAIKAVLKNPGKKYNPLFLYGGVGLGKTHLLQGAGNAFLHEDSKKRVIYTTTEKFMNDLVESITGGKTEKFRAKYRKVDVLIIDDIQFLANREKTQEEFFHTFNVLYDNEKQIILSADKPPKDLAGLTQRLVSRFQSGMIVELETPDFETRVAILRKKSQQTEVLLSHEILSYIAEHFEGSIREMEGILQQVIARVELTGKTPDISTIETMIDTSHLRKEVGKKKKIQKINPIERVLQEIEKISGFSSAEILGLDRNREISNYRHFAIFAIRELTNKSLEDIGTLFSQRNHTTILHSIKKGEAKIVEELFRELWKEIQALCKNS